VNSLDMLVVEDNPGDVRLIREAFEILERPCSLTVTSTGEEAIEKARKHAYDLVFLDLLLPGIDGFEVIRALRNQDESADLLIVVLTGVHSEQMIQQAYAAGANCCLTKPPDFDSLISLLRSATRFWSQVAHPPRKESVMEGAREESRRASGGA